MADFDRRSRVLLLISMAWGAGFMAWVLLQETLRHIGGAPGDDRLEDQSKNDFFR